MRAEILGLRKQGTISAEQARDAFDELESLEINGYSADVTAHEIYHSAEMPKELDLCDLAGTQDWPIQASEFVKVLWPKIVDHLQSISRTCV